MPFTSDHMKEPQDIFGVWDELINLTSPTSLLDITDYYIQQRVGNKQPIKFSSVSLPKQLRDY